MPIVQEFESLSEKLARVTIECERLRAENEHLRKTLADHAPRPDQEQRAPKPTTEGPLSIAHSAQTELSVPQKIALFRSLFRGREDVYRSNGPGRMGMSAILPRAFATGKRCGACRRRSGKRWTRPPGKFFR